MSINGKLNGMFAGLLMAFWMSATGAMGQAYNITVNGVQYDITFTEGSFNSVNTGGILESQPWWGKAAGTADDDSEDFANAMNAAHTLPATGFIATYYIFAHAVDFGVSGDDFVSNTVLSIGGQFVDPLIDGVDQAGYVDTDYYFATATVVPEIDGPVLAQLSLVLGAGYLGLRARRRRNSAA